jgi:hypothetical protein
MATTLSTQLIDPALIGWLIGILVLAGLAGLLYFGHWLEKKGKLKNYSRGLGRGLLEVDSVLRPSKIYVQEAKEKQRKVEDDDGEPPTTAHKENSH